QQDVKSEHALKELIRFAIAKIEPEDIKSFEQTVKELAQTVEISFDELKPLYDTSIKFALTQGAEVYKKETVHSLEITESLSLRHWAHWIPASIALSIPLSQSLTHYLVQTGMFHEDLIGMYCKFVSPLF